MKKINKDDKKEIAELFKNLDKNFGAGTVVTEPIKIEAIPTGAFSLDRALGIGGLPMGKIVEIFGPESGGKTSLALNVVAQVQKLGGRAAYIDVEQALNPKWAEILGVKFNDIALTQPQIGEDALNILVQMAESNKFDLIVLDSVASLMPKAEYEGNIGDQTMALLARLMAQALRKIDKVCSKTNTTVIFINQIREKVGVVWGSKETTPGGRALKFAASVRIDIRKAAMVKDGENIIGIEIKADVRKNKVGQPYKIANYYLLFDKGISLPWDIFKTAVSEQIITKEGNTYSFGDKKIGVGEKKSVSEIENNKELQEEIINKLKSNG